MLSRKPNVETLARDLAVAHEVREQRLKAAHADFENDRQSVIEAGRDHAANLRRLEAESRAEAEKAEAIVRDAQSR